MQGLDILIALLLLITPADPLCDTDAIAREYLPRWEDFFEEPPEDRATALDLLLGDLVYALASCEPPGGTPHPEV
jgi:hypothetical protein